MRVDEIYGPVIAGEGSIAGMQTVFVRLGGCDYRCAWCDTLHAVDPVHADGWEELTPEQIVERVMALADSGTWVSISGGNPGIWQRELRPLVEQLQEAHFKVNIETQGSVPNDGFVVADLVTISPKPPSSGMVADPGRLAECIHQAQGRGVLKFVVGSDDDLAFALDLFKRNPYSPVYAQPVTVLRGGRVEFPYLRKLMEAVAAEPALYRWRVIPQLHALAYGGERGR